MSNKHIDTLIKNLDKGDAYSKAEAFIILLREYGDRSEIIELVTKKLIKLRSYNAFYEISMSDEFNLLPKKEIYSQRIKSKDYRIRCDLLGRNFVRGLSKKDAQNILLNLVQNDPDWRVRGVAFRVLAADYKYFSDDSLMDKIIAIANEKIETEGENDLKNNNKLMQSKAFDSLALLPFEKRLHEFISKELSSLPFRFDPYNLLEPVKGNPSEARTLIPEIKKVIDNMLKIKSSFSGIGSEYSRSPKKIHFISGYEYTDVDRLCSGLLEAYKEDKDTLLYLYEISIKMNNPKSDFLQTGFFVSLIHGPNKASKIYEALLEKYISNRKVDLLIRYYAIENLIKHYKAQGVTEPDDFLQKIMDMIKDAPKDFKEDVATQVIEKA